MLELAINLLAPGAERYASNLKRLRCFLWQAYAPSAYTLCVPLIVCVRTERHTVAADAEKTIPLTRAFALVCRGQMLQCWMHAVCMKARARTHFAWCKHIFGRPSVGSCGLTSVH